MEEEEDTTWKGVENTGDAPIDVDELRVIYCAADSFQQYPRVAHFQTTHLRRQSFYSLPQAHLRLLSSPPFNYLDTLNKVDDCIDSNAELSRAIFKAALANFGLGVPDDKSRDGKGLKIPDEWQGCAKNGDVDKARSTLRQFYRDWSAEGKRERDVCFGNVLRVVEEEQKRLAADEGGGGERLQVLVPGAGLGRLVFELFLRGCVAEGNEISYHQLLASSYILNCCERAGQYTVYPWVHGFSNHRTRADQFRGYRVPDVHCMTETIREQEKGVVGEMSMTAADFLCEYAKEENAGRFDVVAAVFFLDTAPNLIRYLDVIYGCLKPGGVLVNFGPLLWHFEGQMPNRSENGGHLKGDGGGGGGDNDMTGIAEPGNFELTDEEVMELVTKVGFQVESRETGIEAPYIHDTESMLQTVYRASTWVARKPVIKADTS
ncbi:N2227-like protein-domain-containing protein [Apiosordaria backusii]|uniref:carnosine N-methyltransferase n=1 Tax=Apiosordaria backusii TaxID=314023 RepID=A0AA40EHV9_9PEZI|nr:N2227-like protein-domain-containing protein [Apiosordaria backusii]